MTKEQVEKRGEVIKWWLDNPDKGVYTRDSTGCWYIEYTPDFLPNSDYTQNDEYAEFRKALAEGKKVQVKDCEYYWVDGVVCRPTQKFEGPIHIYRIKEPKLKVGDWVIEASTGELKQVVCGPNERVSNKWTPKKNEWCVFWYNDFYGNRPFYTVTRYLNKEDERYFDVDGIAFDNIAPLEFINTLKEK